MKDEYFDWFEMIVSFKELEDWFDRRMMRYWDCTMY